MKTFLEYFEEHYDIVLNEYRHNLADGTSAPSIQAHNGKNPNIMDKKNLHTIGDYKPKNPMVHRVGATFVGDQLTNVLMDYELEFQDGKVSKIKNSPMGIQMFINNGTPTGRIIKTK